MFLLFFLKRKYAIIVTWEKEGKMKEMYNILVCDDDKEIVKAIEIYLVKENYNVLKAYNGEECLKILKQMS